MSHLLSHSRLPHSLSGVPTHTVSETPYPDRTKGANRKEQLETLSTDESEASSPSWKDQEHTRIAGRRHHGRTNLISALDVQEDRLIRINLPHRLRVDRDPNHGTHRVRPISNRSRDQTHPRGMPPKPALPIRISRRGRHRALANAEGVRSHNTNAICQMKP